jgi:hypothetical protein
LKGARDEKIYLAYILSFQAFNPEIEGKSKNILTVNFSISRLIGTEIMALDTVVTFYISWDALFGNAKLQPTEQTSTHTTPFSFIFVHGALMICHKIDFLISDTCSGVWNRRLGTFQALLHLPISSTGP